MINYELERCITNDNNWELYTNLGCDEATAIEMWHYWQEKQPNYKFRMYRVTRELCAISDSPMGVDTGSEDSYSVEATYSDGKIIELTKSLVGTGLDNERFVSDDFAELLESKGVVNNGRSTLLRSVLF